MWDRCYLSPTRRKLTASSTLQWTRPCPYPLILGYDVIHGFRTIFPVPIAMAASWDPATVATATEYCGERSTRVGIGWAFAPMLDIARARRWGRIVEGAGEDPYLGSAIAAAQVRGFQGDYIGSPDHILACMKHFAGYGAAEGGRDYDASYIPESQMYNVYLPPFHAAVKAGVGSAMSAYMDLNDVPATGNHWLLHDVLRDQWNFTGFVVSDANSVKSLEKHHYAKDLSDAAVGRSGRCQHGNGHRLQRVLAAPCRGGSGGPNYAAGDRSRGPTDFGDEDSPWSIRAPICR